MANFNITAALTLTATDTNANVAVLQRTVNIINSNVNIVSYLDYFPLPNGTTSFTLPAANVYGLYVKMLGSGAGTTVQVKWTPQAVADNVIKSLGPGAFIMFLETQITASATSITTLEMIPSAASIPVEVALFG